MRVPRNSQRLVVMMLLIGFIVWLNAASKVNGQSAGRIVFEHVPDGSDPWPVIDIDSMNADGTDLRALTTDGHSHNPTWSPDGRRILYIHDTTWPSNLPGPQVHTQNKEWLSHAFRELYVMDSDGGNPRLLRRFDSSMEGPVGWSPDGKTLAAPYAPPPNQRPPRPPGEPNFDLFLFPVEGPGEPRSLFIQATDPSWSPDGTKLAFSEYQGWGYGYGLAVGDADGSHHVRIIQSQRYDPYPAISDILYPAWSPDGKQIAFAASVTRVTAPLARGVSTQQAVFLINADGSGLHQLTNDPGWICLHPSWSPDGKEIAFSCTGRAVPCRAHAPGCIRRIFTLRLDSPTAAPVQITQHDGANPIFAPGR